MLDSIVSILRYFAFSHLPPHLQEVSKPFCDLANQVASQAPQDPETSIALRKLLESKDAAVRAVAGTRMEQAKADLRAVCHEHIAAQKERDLQAQRDLARKLLGQPEDQRKCCNEIGRRCPCGKCIRSSPYEVAGESLIQGDLGKAQEESAKAIADGVNPEQASLTVKTKAGPITLTFPGELNGTPVGLGLMSTFQAACRLVEAEAEADRVEAFERAVRIACKAGAL